MNDPSKRVQVNSSALLNLKAELFRKQQEYKQDKLNAEFGIKEPKEKPEKKFNIWAKQNKGILERAQHDLEAKHDEEDALQKSRQALEAKAKIYDKLMKEKKLDNLEETNELYLVDFERKILDTEKERRTNERSSIHNDNDTSVPEEPEPASCPEEEWVEFVDALGRTRRCLRKDLAYYKEIDKTLQREPAPTPEIAEPDRWSETNDLLSNDMKMELERQKWEAEAAEDEEEQIPIGPMHYQTVQGQEVRDHGVGYYAFSTEETERRQQQETLQKFRNQTENQRIQSQKMKERRKELLQARLAKVKQRKKSRLGIEESESESADSEIEEMQAEQPSVPEETMTPIPATKAKKVRPWDVGKVTEPVFKSQQKRKMPTEREWLNDRRNDRQAEFAPPQSYYNQSQFKPKQRMRPYKDRYESSATADTSEMRNLSNIPLPDDVR